MECGGRPGSSTVRMAATSAWPITCPPNTRCHPTCGLLPRNRFTSSRSRSRMLRRFSIAADMAASLRSAAQAILPRVGILPCPAFARRDDAYIPWTQAAVASMPQNVKRVDVLIGGAGLAGLALAIALRQALGGPYAVAVADPALGRASSDVRASAIVAAARRLFETIGVWDAVAGEAQPIVDMRITDSRLGDAMRPVFLTFDGDVEPGEPFAHMVENAPLLAALAARAREVGVEILPHAIVDHEIF